MLRIVPLILALALTGCAGLKRVHNAIVGTCPSPHMYPDGFGGYWLYSPSCNDK